MQTTYSPSPASLVVHTSYSASDSASSSSSPSRRRQTNTHNSIITQHCTTHSRTDRTAETKGTATGLSGRGQVAATTMGLLLAAAVVAEAVVVDEDEEVAEVAVLVGLLLELVGLD